jgi:hypothetical protein
MKLKNLLTEAESFTATNKKTGKTSVFKSKDSRDSAVKAGTHTAVKDPKAGGKAKSGVNIFDKPEAGPKKGKDDKSTTPAMKHTKVGEDSLEVKTISNFTNLRAKALSDFINKNKLDATAIANFVKKGSLRDRMDIGTAIVGNPGNKYEKKVIKQFGAKEQQPNVAKGGAGSGRDSEAIAKAKKQLKKANPDWDAEKINQTARALMAHTRIGKKPFKKKETDAKKEEPKSEPAKKRPGNPQVNKEAKAQAEKFGITPQKLGNEKYKKVMFQAAIEALTDSNFHSEARELVASIEGKPEWAKKVDYPSMDDPQYDEKMKAIRTTGVDSSEYWGGDDNAHELGRKVSQASGWGGVEAADGIAFTLRMNGFHKEADKIQSIFDNKPYMRNESMSLVKMIKK